MFHSRAMRGTEATLGTGPGDAARSSRSLYLLFCSFSRMPSPSDGASFFSSPPFSPTLCSPELVFPLPFPSLALPNPSIASPNGPLPILSHPPLLSPLLFSAFHPSREGRIAPFLTPRFVFPRPVPSLRRVKNPRNHLLRLLPFPSPPPFFSLASPLSFPRSPRARRRAPARSVPEPPFVPPVGSPVISARSPR